MKYLVTFSIGPVQEFIASARRSRDLWFGSWLLSELSKAAAKRILDHEGEESLIFPALGNEKKQDLEPYSPFSIVNKITAVVNTQNIATFTDEVRTAIAGRLDALRKEAFQQIQATSYIDQDQAKNQIDDLIEFFCAAVPLPHPSSYQDARKKAEILITARKNTRNFKSASDTTTNWSKEGIPKSSLDGLRESVIKERAYKELSMERRRMEFGTRPGEQLCGVGLLKRLGNRQGEQGFYSTSHLAAVPLLSNLEGQVHETLVKKYFDRLADELEIGKSAWSRVSSQSSSEIHGRISKIFQRTGDPCDGRLLFEDRLAEYFDKGDTKTVRKARQLLKSFLKEALNDRAPNPYYALLLADGDGMGEAIKAQDDQFQHRQFSLRLSELAGQVREIVETKHHGSLIYAGGDDVLAFVPLHTVVQCARVLADRFKEQLKSENGISPTLSIGIAISHHLDPMSDALELVREAEKEAKRFPKKNSLCVTLSKRSGETTTIVDRWTKLDERLILFTLLFAADKLPDGVAYEFRQLAHELAQVPDALSYEIKRVLKRKRAGHGQELLQKNVRKRVTECLEDLSQVKADKSPLARLADELIVARVLAASWEQSYPSQEASQKQAEEALKESLGDSEPEDGGDDANVAD